MKIYRAVSVAEQRNFYENDESFLTARNTLEAKQFFKSKLAVTTFVKESVKQHYAPPYKYLFVVDIDETCLGNIVGIDNQLLDGFEALTVAEELLPAFNNCINFTEQHDEY